MKSVDALSGWDGLEFVYTHVCCGDEDDCLDGGILRGGVACDEAAHAVAEEDDVVGVGAEFFGVDGIAQVGDGGLCVLDGVGEGEVAGRAPGAAIVEEEDVVAVAAEGLGDVEVALVAGEAVEEDDDGMRAGTFGHIDECVEQGAVAGELEGLHGSGVGFVWRGVGCDGRWRLLGVHGGAEWEAEKQSRGKEGMDAHESIVLRWAWIVKVWICKGLNCKEDAAESLE
jgi:hypothetical protein